MPSDKTTVLDASGVGPGGITRVLTELVRHWPAGHELRVIAAPESWEGEAVSRQSGGRERTIAAATAALRKETRGRVLSLSPSLAIAGARLPVTTIVHDLAFRLWPRGLSRAVREYRRISYATAIRRSAALLSVSARTQHDLLGLYEAASAVWHPGSDLALPGTPPPGLPDNYVVVTGHAAHKGVELALEAIRAFPQYSLVVLTGDSQRYPDQDRVVQLGRLDDATYAATVAGARAFLMPSHFEGFGLPAAEALALGVPTIISPDPALHEATAGAATRMRSWTAEALVEALHSLDAPPRRGVRTWKEATDELVERLWS
ncbi:glycosyltransferase [Symbioplanes lichenis]|uniref:glycosyltransferase n=1 Tax=Symbioplanes lichenis TaxID=1629072 RepID=UPI002739B9D4|nr:glycosyltransferase [Actinoplanes lichenis]